MASTTALCWALLAVGLKYALHFSSTGNIVWIRMVFAFFILLAWLWRKNKKLVTDLKRPPLLGILAGLGLAANYWFYMKGIELTGASNAQIMIQIGPLTLILVGIFVFKERPTPAQMVGFCLALIGFAFFFKDQLDFSGTHGQVYVYGSLMIYLAGFTWTFFAAAQKYLFKSHTPQQLNLLVFGVSLLCLMPDVQVKEIFTYSLWQWIVLAALGLNTLIAYGALAEALQRIPASLTSLIITINPLGTIFIMQVLDLWHVQWITMEPLKWTGYVGALFVVAGVALAVSFRHPRPTKV